MYADSLGSTRFQPLSKTYPAAAGAGSSVLDVQDVRVTSHPAAPGLMTLGAVQNPMALATLDEGHYRREPLAGQPARPRDEEPVRTNPILAMEVEFNAARTEGFSYSAR